MSFQVATRVNTPTGKRIPRGCYRVILQGAPNHKPANSGSPMTTVDVQILAPDYLVVDGEQKRVAGEKGQLRFVFSEKGIGSVAEALKKLNIAQPEDAVDQADWIVKVQEIFSHTLPNLTFEMVLESKSEPQLDAARQPIKDSRGQIVPGVERVDFNMFSIVGNPQSLEEFMSLPSPEVAG